MTVSGTDVVAALTQALNGEYAATYAYGLIGAHLPAGTARARALRALDSHRLGRDQLRDAMIAVGASPPPPAGAYQTPERVTSAQTATALAVTVEQRLVRSWSDVASVSGGSSRETAVRAARECAVRAVTWGAPSQAFPS